MQQLAKQQRPITPGKLSILVLALAGAFANMATAHAQTTTITTTQNWTSGDFSINSDTIIIPPPSAHGIDAINVLGTLTNNGAIYAGTSYGIFNQGTISSLINNGIISAYTGIFNEYGTIGVLNNRGVITGNGYSGITNYAGTIGVLNNSGTISSKAGIGNFNSAVIGTLNNSGVIKATASGNAITNYRSLISSLNNSGTISGGTGINNDFGAIDALNNSGLISGSAYAIYFPASGLQGSFVNTGTIAGKISVGAPTAFTITGGSGASFGTLTGYSGGIGVSDIGTITSNGLTFTGNQLLNDNVDAGSSGAVTNLGKLQVNNPLSINGNYVQGSGSTLIIGVASHNITNVLNLNDTGYGRLIVNGSVTLDGSSVTLKTPGYGFAPGQRYVVVAANGGISVTGVSYSATGYSVTGTTMTDSSDPGYTDLVLTLGNSTAVNNATNSNSALSLGGLFKYTGTNSAFLAVFNPAAALDSTAANKAGAQLSPAAVTSAATRAADAANQAIGNVVTSHMDGFRVAQAGSSGVASGERAADIALWGQMFDGRAVQGERDSLSGYHANYRGLVLGADSAVSDSMRAGGLFSASKISVATDGDNTGTSATVNSYGLTAYATYTGAPWYVNVMAGATHQQYRTVRAISYTGFAGVANGNFNGQQYLTSAQAGYPLSLDAWLPGATLTPIAGLSYSSLRTNGYTETGGNGAALTVNSATYNSLKSELGVKLENSVDTAYGKLLPSVQLGWRHEFREDAVQTGASFAADSTGSTAFVSKNATAVANTGVLNLGVTLLQSQRLSLMAKYTLEAGGGYIAQTGSVQVRWQY